METVISDGISPLIPHFHPRCTSRLTDNLAVQARIQNLRVKQRLLKHKYDLISPPDEFFVCGLAAVPARADIVTSCQEIRPDFWALQLKQKQLLTPALPFLLRWCHPLTKVSLKNEWNCHAVYETINRLGCHNGGYSSFLNPVFKRLVLRDSKALQEVDRWLDYSFSALCRGTCRQLRAAPGCNNGSFSLPPPP